MGKRIEDQNFFPVFRWMSRLQIEDRDKDGKPKVDKSGSIKVQNLSGVPKELYAIIYRWSLGKAGCCYLSYTQFQEITGASRSTVIRSLQILIENGLIMMDVIAPSNDKRGNAVITKKYYRTCWNKIAELGVEVDIRLKKNALTTNLWNDFNNVGYIEGDENEFYELIPDVDEEELERLAFPQETTRVF